MKDIQQKQKEIRYRRFSVINDKLLSDRKASLGIMRAFNQQSIARSTQATPAMASISDNIYRLTQVLKNNLIQQVDNEQGLKKIEEARKIM